MNIDVFHYLDLVRKAVMHLPCVEEYTCFQTPAFRVKKKLLARIREDGETLAVHADDRDLWIKGDPSVFFITDHYRNYPFVLVKLPVVKEDVLQQLLLESWKRIAPKRLLKEFEDCAWNNK